MGLTCLYTAYSRSHSEGTNFHSAHLLTCWWYCCLLRVSCSVVANCLDQLRAYESHKLRIYSQVTLKALRGTNMIEQWGIKCMQSFKKCGPLTTGFPWTSFVQFCLSFPQFFVTYQCGSHCTDFYWNLKVEDVNETLWKKIQIWLKSGKKLLVALRQDSSTKYYVADNSKKNPLLHLRDSTGHFYIVES
jgi:hypothetical protein